MMLNWARSCAAKLAPPLYRPRPRPATPRAACQLVASGQLVSLFDHAVAIVLGGEDEEKTLAMAIRAAHVLVALAHDGTGGAVMQYCLDPVSAPDRPRAATMHCPLE